MTTRFLVFTFAAPLMAFGDIAVGERRGTWLSPSRSGLLGLVAAALGMRRDDDRQETLARSLAFAARIDSAGELLVDYHTTQTAPARRNRRFATRREELGLPPHERATILSRRDYRADAAFTIAAISVAEGPFSLDDIAAALTRPALPIHAGRRACPLGLPPAARVIEAPDLPGAFALYDALEGAAVSGANERSKLRRVFKLGEPEARSLTADIAFERRSLLGTARLRRRQQRRDEPRDRVRWQFAPRTELIVELESAP